MNEQEKLAEELDAIWWPLDEQGMPHKEIWLRVAAHVLKREEELRKDKELAIEQLIDMAGFYCEEMEGQGNPEFAIYEFAMCDCIDRLKRIGVKYDPCSGKREALSAEKPESK